LPPILTAGLS